MYYGFPVTVTHTVSSRPVHGPNKDLHVIVTCIRGLAGVWHNKSQRTTIKRDYHALASREISKRAAPENLRENLSEKRIQPDWIFLICLNCVVFVNPRMSLANQGCICIIEERDVEFLSNL